MENALNFSPRGETVEVQVGLEAASPESPVRVLVLDRGTGVGDRPDELFERFFREDPARTRGAIAVAHGGRVRAAARPGGGAEISASLAQMKAP